MAPSITMSVFIIPPLWITKIILDYLLGVPSIGKINPIFFLQQLSPPYLWFTLTLWGSEICNFGINLYYLCWCRSLQKHFRLPSGGPSSITHVFLEQLSPTIFAIYFDTLGVQICNFGIDVDVNHYKNILDYLLGVPSIGKINPIFFCNN